jgi:hypothetical protein
MGTLSLIACTVCDNVNGNTGILNQGGTMVILNSTIGRNANNGITNFGPLATLLLGNSTVSENLCGGISNESDSKLRIRNTIVAGNTAAGFPDVSGLLESLGYNLIGIGDGGSGYVDTDLVGTSANPIDPLLGSLQDNGGPTPTMALLPGSPAINAGGLTDSEWDQRGSSYPRLVNGATDIGAYQVQPNGGSAAAMAVPQLTLQILPLPETRPRPANRLAEVSDGPRTQSVLLRPAVAAVDGCFAALPQEAADWIGSRSRRAARTQGDSGLRDWFLFRKSHPNFQE